MFVKERLNLILQILNDNGKIEVTDLSNKFSVSKDLIRKDLQKLEDQGLLERTYGGAIPKRAIAKNYSVLDRMSSNIDEKKSIARKAFRLIQPFETIFLDVTSINYFLAEEIANSGINVTVITNMIDIMHFLYHSPNVRLIGIGGVLNKNLDGFTGSISIEQIQKYKSDKAFVGVVGIDLISGTLTTFDPDDGLTKNAIIESSKNKYLITEKQKIYQDGNFVYSNIEVFNGIISGKLPDEVKKRFKKNHLTVI